MKYLVTIVFAILLLVRCNTAEEPASLFVTNARIWTANAAQPYAEAMAIRGDTILAIGSMAELAAFDHPNIERVDAEGKFIVPGFTDSHVHLMTGGRSLLSVDLRDATTPDEFKKRVKAFTQTLKPGEWLLEGNWDHTLWDGTLPDKDWIDSFTGDNPAFLVRLDWHMALANSAALDFAGVDKNTKDVEGGEIGRDAAGKPTGILKDNAMKLVLDKIPHMTGSQKVKAFEAAMQYFAKNGITSVHDMDGLNNEVSSLGLAKQFLNEGKLNVRIYGMAPLAEWKKVVKGKKMRTKWIRSGGLKGFVDGSVGSHTAAFHAPYHDDPAEHGLFVNTNKDLKNWILAADKANFHIMVHAIGDSANHTLLDIYEQVIAENGARDRRFRIEHAQHLNQADIGRFNALGVIASMQPYHIIDDGRWAEEYIGRERLETSYAYKSLLEKQATLTFGSDWAVSPASPIMGIYAATTRRTLDDKNEEGWIPSQLISVQDALIAYTKTPAYASFEEDIKGTLEKGKLADFVILDKDLFKIALKDIRNVQVLETYVGGKKVYSN